MRNGSRFAAMLECSILHSSLTIAQGDHSKFLATPHSLRENTQNSKFNNMDKKRYTAPDMEVISVETCGMLATSPDDLINLIWAGDEPGTAGPDEIDDNSTFDSF